MRIFINEFIKVFNKRTILLLFVGLLSLNGLLLYVNDTNDLKENYFYTSKSYKEIYKDIEGLSKQEALELLESTYEELDFLFHFSIMNNNISLQLDDEFNDIDLESLTARYRSGEYLSYTDSLWAETSLYKDIIKEIKACQSYPDYLDNIDKEAETMLGISIFAKADSFSYRNIEKTPGAYSHLKGNELDFSPSRGVKMATEFFGTDLIAIFMILIIITSLVTREKELSQLTLIKTTYLGRRPLVISKLMVSFVSSLFVAIALYTVNFIISFQIYGFGDIGRYIQSVSGYISSNLEISVLQYFILFIIGKVVVYCLIAAIIFFVATLARNSSQVYIALITIFAVSGISYYVIESTSYLSIFKYVNIVSFMNTYKFFTSYLNLNIFGQPINYIPIAFLAIIIGITFFTLISINVFCKQKALSSKTTPISERLKLSINFNKIPIFTYKTTSIFRHESYKVFIGGRVLLILIVFLAIKLYSYQPLSEDIYDMDAFHYKDYMLQLEGELNEDKIKFIEEEDARFTKVYEEISSIPGEQLNPYIILSYQEELASQVAFEKVKYHTEYLKSTDNGEYLYDSGYKLLTGDASAMNKDIHLALVAFIITIACIAYIYSVEYQSGGYVLQQTSYKGRKSTFACKLMIAMIIISIIYVTSYLPYLYNVLSTYGKGGILAPANSMEHLSKIPGGISILSYLTIISLMRYMGMFLAVIIIFILSKWLKSYMSTLLASTGLLVLPLLLSLMGITIFDYVLLNPLIIGNVF